MIFFSFGGVPHDIENGINFTVLTALLLVHFSQCVIITHASTCMLFRSSHAFHSHSFSKSIFVSVSPMVHFSVKNLIDCDQLILSALMFHKPLRSCSTSLSLSLRCPYHLYHAEKLPSSRFHLSSCHTGTALLVRATWGTFD